MSTETVQTPQERLAAANERFARLNRALPAGIGGFQIPPWTELTATVDGLARVLHAHGLIDAQEFDDAKTTRLAELVEDMCVQAEEVKRSMTGLVIAQPGQTL